ncbi:MAG: AAA family ATPase [Mariniphaga sp.]
MFIRDIENELNNWSLRSDRKPLVLRGARQVGKTTVVNKFGEQFENYLYVNLEKAPSKQLIESTDDVKKLLPLLFLYCNKPRKEGKTLLFIDEIQASSHALSLLRYFYEDTPEIFVIAAGSLLETMLDKHVSLPVGRVEYMAIHPCSFIEYLRAIGEGRFVNLITKAELPNAFHEEILQHFHLYALIGGMPEVVARYTASKDIVALSRTYNQLLNGYKNDVEKYAESNKQANVIRYILDEGWAFSGQAITLGGFASSVYKARETGEAFRTLNKAMLLELVYPTTNVLMPAVSDLKKSPKLFWLDAGLVNYASGIQREYLLNKDLMDAWRGMAAEQIVAQELKALSFETGLKRNYWMRNKRGSTAEVDFITVSDGKIIPIEVKSGHNAHLKSIHQFMNDTNHDIAIRIWSGNYSVDKVKTINGKEFRLINLPFYQISALPHILANVWF